MMQEAMSSELRRVLRGPQWRALVARVEREMATKKAQVELGQSAADKPQKENCE